MNGIIAILALVCVLAVKFYIPYLKRKQRREYYGQYLKSDEWERKRYLVLKRDNYECVFCGARATQVHHKHYAKKNIGKEPIKWLVSVCEECHKKRHNKLFI
jgi:5-methylcytosine-specific restriction endonuclease McrA